MYRLIKNCWAIVLSFVLLFGFVHAQQKQRTNNFTLKTQFYQSKEDFNYGLVFNGLMLSGAYSLVNTDEANTFIYNPELGFGSSYNKGIGLVWEFVPINIFYGFNLSENLSLGAYVATNYNWQLYPELQSGHMFWFTSLEVGPQVLATVPIKKRLFNLTFSNSLAGFTSRPEPATETHFYALTLSDFISNAHKDLGFGSFDTFNHSKLQIELQNRREKKLSFAYEFDYLVYLKEPGINFMSHAVNLKWKIGKR